MQSIRIAQKYLTCGLASREDAQEIVQMAFEEYDKQPDECTDGGNDKKFYSFKFKGENIFVVWDCAYSPETHQTDSSAPERYTIMLASEY